MTAKPRVPSNPRDLLAWANLVVIILGGGSLFWVAKADSNKALDGVARIEKALTEEIKPALAELTKKQHAEERATADWRARIEERLKIKDD